MRGLTVVLACCAMGVATVSAVVQVKADDVAATEKEKALRDPYANDMGPEKLPTDLVKTYPAEVQKGYKLLLVKCAQCHQPSRPLNSQFDDGDTWKRYVKRMMRKPGCEIASAEGKAIWTFLVHDSKVRKTGKNKARWDVHRKKLLKEFKQKHPERYKLLYEDKE